MKHKNTFSAVCGISQRKLAMMLGVGFSQFSMHEYGLRPLASHANRLLIEMELLFYDGNSITTAGTLQDKDAEKHAAIIKKKLEDNLHEQYALARDIKAAEAKFNKRVETLNFLQKLSLKQEKNESGEPTLPELLAGQTARKLQKENWTTVRQMQLKLEVMKFEEKLLREEMGEKE